MVLKVFLSLMKSIMIFPRKSGHFERGFRKGGPGTHTITRINWNECRKGWSGCYGCKNGQGGGNWDFEEDF